LEIPTGGNVAGTPAGELVTGGRVTGGNVTGGNVAGGKVTGGNVTVDGDFVMATELLPVLLPLELATTLAPTLPLALAPGDGAGDTRMVGAVVGAGDARMVGAVVGARVFAIVIGAFVTGTEIGDFAGDLV